MGKKRMHEMMFRWSIATFILIAVFWTIWYSVAGTVPSITAVGLTPNYAIQLPFGISRWWDILMTPICSIFLVSLLAGLNYFDEKLFTFERKKEKESDLFFLVIPITFGFFGGIALYINFASISNLSFLSLVTISMTGGAVGMMGISLYDSKPGYICLFVFNLILCLLSNPVANLIAVLGGLTATVLIVLIVYIIRAIWMISLAGWSLVRQLGGAAINYLLVSDSQ